MYECMREKKAVRACLNAGDTCDCVFVCVCVCVCVCERERERERDES